MIGFCVWIIYFFIICKKYSLMKNLNIFYLIFNLLLYFILKKNLYVVLLSLFVYILKYYKYYKI